MRNKEPRIGKFILDSLSVGMYNHPLMLIREYIQNSTDAIDESLRKGDVNKGKSKIEINIDGKARCLEIIDNGVGVSTDKAWNTLHDIGKSEKNASDNRGFRGIGRLGGLGYCEDLQFVTKAKGEKIYSVTNWKCGKLRTLINEKNEYNTSDLIKEITEFNQNHYRGNYEDHFFIVKMMNLQSSRDILLNVPEIKDYLSEVAPVPFNSKTFSYADEIERKLIKNVPKYKTYNIYINGEQIFKPYSDLIMLRGDKKDKIRSIEFVELKNLYSSLAFGWTAELNLLGSIHSSSLMEGLRVRCGNILIGDKSLLSDFFRERRFNNYLLGELHVVDCGLIPNSRRDDFEDNGIREEFYDSFIKKIGLPYSRKIRQTSLERNKNRENSLKRILLERTKLIIENGYFSEFQKNKIIEELLQLKNDKSDGDGNVFIDDLIAEINESKHFLLKHSVNFTDQTVQTLKSIFDIIFKECRDKNLAEKIISKIINEVTCSLL